MADYEMTVKGLSQLMRKCQQFEAAVIGPPVRQMFSRIGIDVENNIKPFVPVDEGILRSRITHQVDGGALPKWVKVGVLNDGKVGLYGRVMEFGRKPGKFPPMAAIERWAARHGIRDKGAVFLIARKIARKGIKGRRFLQRGFEASKGRAVGYVAQAAREIEARWRT